MTSGLPCVIDIEASGFGGRSDPIEVGHVLPDGQARCTLIRPLPEWTHRDERAATAHRIERDTLLRLGRPAADVARRLNADLGGRTVYGDGWAHDCSWLAALFEAAGAAPGFRLASVAALLDDARLARLAETQRAARDELGPSRHRASSDARVLQMALGRRPGG